MSLNIQQIFTANPASSLLGTDLIYLGRSPYGTSNDFAITGANLLSSVTSGAVLLAPSGTQTITGFGLTVPALTVGTSALTLGGALTTSGAFGSTFTMTGTSNVTFPTSGTLATTSQLSNAWVDETGASVTMATNTGYTSDDGATLVTFTLPTTSAIGDFIEINGKGAGLWKIAQAAGQQIHFGSSATTSGIGGSLASTLQFDNVRLRCLTASTIWTVVSVQGTLTVV